MSLGRYTSIIEPTYSSWDSAATCAAYNEAALDPSLFDDDDDDDDCFSRWFSKPSLTKLLSTEKIRERGVYLELSPELTTDVDSTFASYYSSNSIFYSCRTGHAVCCNCCDDVVESIKPRDFSALTLINFKQDAMISSTGNYTVSSYCVSDIYQYDRELNVLALAGVNSSYSVNDKQLIRKVNYNFLINNKEKTSMFVGMVLTPYDASKEVNDFFQAEQLFQMPVNSRLKKVKYSQLYNKAFQLRGYINLDTASRIYRDPRFVSSQCCPASRKWFVNLVCLYPYAKIADRGVSALITFKSRFILWKTRRKESESVSYYPQFAQDCDEEIARICVKLIELKLSGNKLSEKFPVFAGIDDVLACDIVDWVSIYYGRDKGKLMRLVSRLFRSDFVTVLSDEQDVNESNQVLPVEINTDNVINLSNKDVSCQSCVINHSGS
jgi:hypothetical protein